MSDLLSPALAALVARLRADGPLASVLGTPPRVFDHLPVNAPFPYVVVSYADVRDAGAKAMTALSAALLITVYHRDRTQDEARRVLSAVRDNLHDATLSGVARCQEEFVGFSGETGEARRAVARYRLILSA